MRGKVSPLAFSFTIKLTFQQSGPRVKGIPRPKRGFEMMHIRIVSVTATEEVFPKARTLPIDYSKSSRADYYHLGWKPTPSGLRNAIPTEVDEEVVVDKMAEEKMDEKMAEKDVESPKPSMGNWLGMAIEECVSF